MSHEDWMNQPSSRQFVQRHVENALVRHGVRIWSSLAGEIRSRAVIDLPPFAEPTVRVNDENGSFTLDDYIEKRKADPSVFDSFVSGKPRIRLADTKALLNTDLEAVSRGDVVVVDDRKKRR